MAYSTLADLQGSITDKILRELTDEENNGKQIIQSKIDAAITIADNEIDGWLAKRYTVPFSPVPALVNSWSVILSIYYLYLNSSEKIPRIRQRLYDQIASPNKTNPGALKRVADGDSDIPGITVDSMFSHKIAAVDHFDSDSLTNEET